MRTLGDTFHRHFRDRDDRTSGNRRILFVSLQRITVNINSAEMREAGTIVNISLNSNDQIAGCPAVAIAHDSIDHTIVFRRIHIT